MSADLTALWAKLSANEQDACEKILAARFSWPVRQSAVVAVVGEVGNATIVGRVEALVRKGVLRRSAGTCYLFPTVDLAQLVPPKSTPAQAWVASAPRHAAPPPLSAPAVMEVGPAPLALDPERVIAVVAAESQLPAAAIRGYSILSDATKWRAVAVYLIKIHCCDRQGELLGSAYIGVIFGTRAAADVLAMFREVRSLLEYRDEWYVPRIERLEQKLGLRSSPAPESAMGLERTWDEPQP